MESKMIKLAGIITEKKELGGAYIEQLHNMTDKNEHTLARLKLAQHIGDRGLVKAYTNIYELHMYMADMNDLKKARARLDKRLFSMAKKYFSDWNQILGAF